MATGSTSRKAPVTTTADPKASLATGTRTPDKPNPIKLKKSTSKLSASVASSRLSSPAVVLPDAAGEPDESPQTGDQTEKTTQRCKHCKKQVERQAFPSHVKVCLKAKQERMRIRKEKEEKALEKEKEKEKSGSVAAKKGEGAPAMNVEAGMKDAEGEEDASPTAEKPKPPFPKKSAPPTAPADTDGKKAASASAQAQSKKRKADEGPSPAPADKGKPPTKKQKRKEEAKAKAVKPKGPVDVEKQCGVVLPNGQMCARSLTCKSHSMGSKRAVPGRSLPYDMLLAQYQKKNQAKQQKAALASTAPLPDDLLDTAAGPIDSDEEKEAVMLGISRAAPRPLFEIPVVSARSRYAYIRMKEMLGTALGGSRGAGLFGIGSRGEGSAVAGSVDGMGSKSNSAVALSAGGRTGVVKKEGLGGIAV